MNTNQDTRPAEREFPKVVYCDGCDAVMYDGWRKGNNVFCDTCVIKESPEFTTFLDKQLTGGMTLAQADKILADPSTHYWVKEQYDVLAEMDPVDAYYDALALAQMARVRMNYALGKVA